MTKIKRWLTKEGLLKIEGWARDGLIDEQIAHNMGVSRATLRNWRKKHPIMEQAVRRGKEVVDREVENALFKRATGYTYEEVTVERQQNGGELQSVETKRVKRQVPPDSTAIIFWLKNRKPRAWRDRREIDHSGEMKQTVVERKDLRNLSVEELKQIESILKKSTDS
ncbi:transposase [Bacillus thuringiensis]|uniref:transposase n=1 Tax=Bacillus thuringiensis TaxID=1428 RepID=UPI003B97D41B